MNDLTTGQGIAMDLNNLSAAQRAGQRMMVGFDGTRLDDTLKYYIEALGVGGLILFARNMSTPQEVSRLCQSAQDFADRCGHPPLLIGIDQEGGVVSRLKPPFTQFKGAPSIQNKEQAVSFAKITARELGQIGVNMNMAPVMDVLPSEGPSVMQDRSFGRDPDQVARMGTTIIQCFQRHGIMAVAKHFPGIGRTVLDSHHELPDLHISAQALYDTDVQPFQQAIAADVAGVMLSHIRYISMDPQWPASLSPAIAGELLRTRLGFEGVTLTDDLDMGAIAKHYGPAEVVEQCLKAQIDILLVCHPGDKIPAVHDHILRVIDQNKQAAQDASAALTRIRDLKIRYLQAS